MKYSQIAGDAGKPSCVQLPPFSCSQMTVSNLETNFFVSSNVVTRILNIKDENETRNKVCILSLISWYILIHVGHTHNSQRNCISCTDRRLNTTWNAISKVLPRIWIRLIVELVMEKKGSWQPTKLIRVFYMMMQPGFPLFDLRQSWVLRNLS